MIKHFLGAPITKNKISEADYLLARFETQFPYKSPSQQQEIAAYEKIFRYRDQKKLPSKKHSSDEHK